MRPVNPSLPQSAARWPGTAGAAATGCLGGSDIGCGVSRCARPAHMLHRCHCTQTDGVSSHLVGQDTRSWLRQAAPSMPSGVLRRHLGYSLSRSVLERPLDSGSSSKARLPLRPSQASLHLLGRWWGASPQRLPPPQPLHLHWRPSLGPWDTFPL